jgi:hypothetical protein
LLLATLVVTPRALRAEPLAELGARVAEMRNVAAMRLEVEVEVKERGSAPLHLRGTRQRGGAVIEWGPEGVESLEQWWLGTGGRLSVWKRAQRRPVIDEGDRVLSEVEAAELADPAAMLGELLADATLLSDETSTWEGRPARRLAIRPALLAPREGLGEGESREPQPLALLLHVWLDEAGAPIAIERSVDFELGPALAVRQRQTLVLRQLDGRLLVAEMRETWSGRALALLRRQEDRRVVLHSVEGASSRAGL